MLISFCKINRILCHLLFFQVLEIVNHQIPSPFFQAISLKVVCLFFILKNRHSFLLYLSSLGLSLYPFLFSMMSFSPLCSVIFSFFVLSVPISFLFLFAFFLVIEPFHLLFFTLPSLFTMSFSLTTLALLIFTCSSHFKVLSCRLQPSLGQLILDCFAGCTYFFARPKHFFVFQFRSSQSY